MTRSTTEPIVLDTLYQLARVQPPVRGETLRGETLRGETQFSGHPLAVEPRGAAWLFYALWPLLLAGAAWLYFRVRS